MFAVFRVLFEMYIIHYKNICNSLLMRCINNIRNLGNIPNLKDIILFGRLLENVANEID
jgi:hypothetical protein